MQMGKTFNNKYLLVLLPLREHQNPDKYHSYGTGTSTVWLPLPHTRDLESYSERVNWRNGGKGKKDKREWRTYEDKIKGEKKFKIIFSEKRWHSPVV